MSGPGDFLSRWSRRKHEADKEKPADDTPARGDEPEREKKIAAVPDEAAEQSEPAFDLAKLPSLESIVADTDIRAFLMPGVPAALRQAALRRAWSADPKIRDFIEMAENQWDFNAPGVPGFDLSAPTGDLTRMVADIFGKTPAPESPERAADATASPESDTDPHRNVNESTVLREVAAEIPSAESAQGIHPVRQTVIAGHKGEEMARQENDAAQEDDDRPPRRSHGGAMPR